MSYLSQPQNSNRKMIAIGLAVIVHLFLGYALVTGLAFQVAKKLITETQAVDIKQEKPPEDTPPPPPEKLEEIPVVTPPPIVTVQNQPPPPAPITTVVTNAVPPAPSNTVTTAPPPPTPAPAPPAPKPAVAASNATPRGNRTGWFTDDDYPEAARRESAEGTTGVSLVINEQGRVASCTVTKSAGNKDLDDTTCRLFQRRGKYNPAKAEGGAPIQQTIADRVTWRLPKE